MEQDKDEGCDDLTSVRQRGRYCVYKWKDKDEVYTDNLTLVRDESTAQFEGK